jgi:hypothetical protein
MSIADRSISAATLIYMSHYWRDSWRASTWSMLVLPTTWMLLRVGDQQNGFWILGCGHVGSEIPMLISTNSYKQSDTEDAQADS